MNNQNKGLADSHEEEFILNESGTSVSNDMDEVTSRRADEVAKSGEQKNKDNNITFKTDEPEISNDIASDEYSRLEDDTIKPTDDTFPDHKNYEDKDADSGTENK